MIADYLAYGGLAMERSGENERRVRDGGEPSTKMTGMAVLKMNPAHLAELKVELVNQMRTTGKAKFILPFARGKRSSE
jgi:hypothetical protein